MIKNTVNRTNANSKAYMNFFILISLSSSPTGNSISRYTQSESRNPLTHELLFANLVVVIFLSISFGTQKTSVCS